MLDISQIQEATSRRYIPVDYVQLELYENARQHSMHLSRTFSKETKITYEAICQYAL